MTTYKPTQVARMTGISTSSVKVYTTRHTSHFSPGATPEPGARRYFSENDAKVLAFIAHFTDQGVNHDEIAAKLADGELSAFEWTAPTTPRQDDAQNAQEAPGQPAGLVLWQEWRDMNARFQEFTQEASEREAKIREEALQREITLRDELTEAKERAARAEGELTALKEARRPWWARWFGREG